MKLYETLPDNVTVHGKKIKCDFDFRNVLRMLDTLDREDLTPDARQFLAAKCITRRPGKYPRDIVRAACLRLFADKKSKSGQKKITDFDQDADYIRAAFLQEYGINLYRDKLHWCEFIALVSCLPEGSRYTEILGIRTRPMPKPTKYNQEERNWLARAKAEYAVGMSEKEELRSLNSGLRSVAMSLLALAERGDGNG